MSIDDMFAGRGSPALMSPNEPAIHYLRDRYSESFALVPGLKQNQVHLFLIRIGLWALVWTFSPKDFTKGENTEDTPHTFSISLILDKIVEARDGKNNALLEKLDRGVKSAQERIRTRGKQLNMDG